MVWVVESSCSKNGGFFLEKNLYPRVHSAKKPSLVTDHSPCAVTASDHHGVGWGYAEDDVLPLLRYYEEIPGG